MESRTSVAYMNRSSRQREVLDTGISEVYISSFYTGLTLILDDSQLLLEERRRLQRVDKKLQSGAEKMALALGIDLSK